MSASLSTERLFILGAPRSGTTFLASLLASTRFGRPIETHFITKYFKKLEQYGDISQKNNFCRLAKDILAERPVMQWKLKVTPDELFASLQPKPSLEKLTDHLMLLATRQDENSPNAWGDKTPHYLGDWPILLELFPKAKFIFIARDGRDVALSLFQKPWGPSTTIGCARYWATLNGGKAQLQKALKPDQILFLTYEELIESPREHVTRIYQFLEEAVATDIVEELVAPTKRKNANKWPMHMNNRQKRQFEAIARDELESLGYPLAYGNAKLYPGENLAFSFLERLNRFIFLFRANVIDGFKIRFLGKQPFAE